MKTLKVDSFFYRKVKHRVPSSISDVFHPNTTFVMKLRNGSWVLYQEKNRELIKGTTLQRLLNKSFKITEHEFRRIARLADKAEANMIDDVFASVDNYNLEGTVYIIDK